MQLIELIARLLNVLEAIKKARKCSTTSISFGIRPQIIEYSGDLPLLNYSYSITQDSLSCMKKKKCLHSKIQHMFLFCSPCCAHLVCQVSQVQHLRSFNATSSLSQCDAHWSFSVRNKIKIKNNSNKKKQTDMHDSHQESTKVLQSRKNNCIRRD